MLGELVAFVVPLAFDSFAVAAALGIAGTSPRDRWRIGGLFALFEGGMPLIGLLTGAGIGHVLGIFADYLAAAALVGYGIFSFVHEDAEESRIAALRRTTGWGAVVLGVSISVDELAIGFTLGLARLPVLPAVIAIAVQAFLASQLGLLLGARISHRMREGAEKIAAVVLVGLGLFLFAEAVFRA